MKNNFNFKQFLTENKLGPYSKIAEAASTKQVFTNYNEFAKALFSTYPDARKYEEVIHNGPTGPVMKLTYGYSKGIQAIEYGQWDLNRGKGYVVTSQGDASDNIYPQGSSRD
jgi:hypothetical protein